MKNYNLLLLIFMELTVRVYGTKSFYTGVFFFIIFIPFHSLIELQMGIIIV